MFAHAGQRLLQGIRGVCVIHHHQRLLAATDPAHAPRHRLQLRQCRRDVLYGQAQGVQHPGDSKQIVKIEAADQCRVHRGKLAADAQHEHQALAAGFDRVRRDHCLGMATRTGPNARHRRRKAAKQLRSERVIEVDHRRRQPGPVEQLRLGSAVARHVAVVIEVIATEIGEHGQREAHRVDASLFERMRGNFHRDMAGALRPHVVEQTMHLQHVRRGALAGRQRAVQARPERTDGAGDLAARVQRLRDQLHGRGLAVGSGYANHSHRRRRPIVVAISDRAQHRTQPRHRNRVVGCAQCRRKRWLVDHRCGAVGQCRLRKRNAMRAAASKGKKRVAGANRTAIEA